MFEQEKINLLYQRIIENQKFTIKDVNNIYIFGMELFNIHDYNKAKLIFKKCLEIDNNHYKSLYQLFLLSIKDYDYHLACQYLNHLYNLNNELIRNNLNLYLYVLNFVTVLPKKLLAINNNLTLDDLLLKKEDNCEVNNIRTLVYYEEFRQASKCLVKLLKKEKLNVNNNLEYLLYKQANILREKQTNFKLKLIKNHNFAELKKIILTSSNNLTIIDKEILKIINEPSINIDTINYQDNKLINTLLKEINSELKKEFIEDKLKEILDFKIQSTYENGLAILDNVYSNKDQIYNYIKKNNDIAILEINQEIILKYSPYPSKIINFDQIFNEGKIAYNNKDYSKCINLYRELLEQSSTNSYLYAQLGLAYMKIFNLENAITYLKVASMLNKKYDYRKLIESLKDSLKQEQSFEFKPQLNDYYGISNINDIFALLKQGNSIEDISKNLELNEEQLNLINLIIAREYYSIDNYYIGDIYLKKVLKSKNKTLIVKNILEEITQNKKFYKNRDHISLLLTKD